ncbi:hypothetical protein ACFO25_16820 [Paenactinomyces guangxiensis]|uniref:hypothetical protein n=1 Tax=Paenactinomyces guangxiensis TaxID=1490290 RepID=UPI001E4DE7A1|nr:hypothetical protein [Paenactinomyces guangxiensis]
MLNLKETLRPGSISKELIASIETDKGELTNIQQPDDVYRQNMYSKYYNQLNNYGIFIAEKGLEEDLYNSYSLIQDSIRALLNYPTTTYTDEEVIEKMKKKKSTFMYHFVDEYLSDLSSIAGCELAEPLYYCKQVIEELRHV